MQGLSYLPKPYISRVLIENGKSSGPPTPGFVDLYYDKEVEVGDPVNKTKIKLTFDLVLKSLYPVGGIAGCNSALLQSAISAFNDRILWYKLITSKSVFEDFLAADNKAAYFIENIPEDLHIPDQTKKIKTNDLGAYVYYDDNTPLVNMPVKVQRLFEYNATEGDNPDFLACVFMHSNKLGELDPATTFFASEIVFMNGQIPDTIAAFTIGHTYSLDWQEFPIDQSTATLSQVEKDPLTGLPIEEKVATTISQFLVKKYGMPTQIYCGPVHRIWQAAQGQPMGWRYMAGTAHNNLEPHPYLNQKMKANDKIIDNRVIGEIQNMFTYNSSAFERLLAQADQTVYLAKKNKNTIGEYNTNPAIVSEVDYAIHKIPSEDGTKEGKVNLWFAIDKLALLKETSPLTPLLEKLTAINTSAVPFFLDRLNIINFEISRIDLKTGVSSVLLVSNNDTYATDIGMTNALGNPTDKGFVFRKADYLSIQVEDAVPHIDYYEFRDGELNMRDYDKGHYTYKISLKFRDPIIGYLSEQLGVLRKILKDLDELILKSSLKVQSNTHLGVEVGAGSIYGANTAPYDDFQMIDAYNRFYDKFTPAFLDKALLDPSFFTFNFVDEIPQSLVEGFGNLNTTTNTLKEGSLSNLLYLFAILNMEGQIQPKKNFLSNIKNGVYLQALGQFIKTSSRLTTATPTLLGQVRDLIGILENKTTKILSIYSPAFITKFLAEAVSATDQEKGQGNLYWKATSGTDPGLISFTHKFTKTLDLEKMSNHFDWVEGIAPSDSSLLDRLKVINVGDYTEALTRNLKMLLKPDAANAFTSAASPSFLPYLNTNSLGLFNVSGKGFMKKSYQSMRNRLLGRHTDKEQNISIPEILAYYGMRFDLGTPEDIQLANAQAGANEANKIFWANEATTAPVDSTVDTSAGADDNFGTNFLPTLKPPGESNSPFGSGGSSPTITNPFGAVDNVDYKWQGGPLAKYPLNAAKSLITLLFSDNMEHFPLRGLELYNVNFNPFYYGGISTTAPTTEAAKISTNQEVPTPINLLALLGSKLFSHINLDEAFFGQIFNADGSVRLENYQSYVRLLLLFGRVHYFRGFEPASFQLEKAPTDVLARSQIKSRIWAPLTHQRLNSLSAGEMLYCKIDLYTDGRHVDKKFLKLLSAYENYNQTFYIRGTPLAVTAAPGLIEEISVLPVPSAAGLSGGRGATFLPAVTLGGFGRPGGPAIPGGPSSGARTGARSAGRGQRAQQGLISETANAAITSPLMGNAFLDDYRMGVLEGNRKSLTNMLPPMDDALDLEIPGP